MSQDPLAGRFLNSEDKTERPDFEALGHSGSGHYVGLETFPNPGVVQVSMETEEVTALCPITGQPDYYTVRIQYQGTEKCIESKSLKLYLHTFRDKGLFCEAFACLLRDEVGMVLGLDEDETMDKVKVTLLQRPRGGISIQAVA